MIAEKIITLALYDNLIEAKIVTLTADLAESKVMGEWWGEACLKRPFDPQPIDRYWNWGTIEIEFEGRILASEKVAIITGEDEELAVQGAMMVSTEPVKMVDGKPCLLLELLFSAPRNRPLTRQDQQQFVVGVGTQLLTWAAHLSREKGYEGRLRLDSSPDFVRWYEKRGLQRAKLDPIVYEDVTYTPMELPEEAARELLSAWNED